MPSWGWILLGALLLGSELFVDSGFYLLFLGLAGLLMGAAGLAGIEGEIWEEWLAFAIVSVVLVASLRSRIYGRLTEARGTAPALIGEVGTAGEDIACGEAGEDIACGETGRAELRGSQWTARNVGDGAIARGARMRVEEIEGLLLLVRAESESAREDEP